MTSHYHLIIRHDFVICIVRDFSISEPSRLVLLYTCIQDEPGSNLGWDSNYPD
jgi:hypothetical protein